MDGWMDVWNWMDGWMDGWMELDGWMDGWMGGGEGWLRGEVRDRLRLGELNH